MQVGPEGRQNTERGLAVPEPQTEVEPSDRLRSRGPFQKQALRGQHFAGLHTVHSVHALPRPPLDRADSNPHRLLAELHVHAGERINGATTDEPMGDRSIRCSEPNELRLSGSCDEQYESERTHETHALPLCEIRTTQCCPKPREQISILSALSLRSKSFGLVVPADNVQHCSD